MSFLINCTDLFNYLGYCSRPFFEGEAVLNAKHLMYFGIMDKSDFHINIRALCVQSTDIYGPPHEIKLSIKLNDITINCLCSCKGGSKGNCKHCSALLMYLIK